ncbi:MAG: peptidylprolyl isomerase, partial [Parasporobacterium sp.]|nr:peptidylprolyl isomerase [Parasporobacterium sp.]
LSGCAEIKVTHPIGKDTILEINDVVCSTGTAVARILEAREEYASTGDAVLWTRKIGDVTFAEYVKEQAKDDIMRYTASQVMAENLTIFITDEEYRAAQADGQRLYEELSAGYDLASYDMNVDDVIDLFIKRKYYEKVYDKLSENIKMQISESDTKAIEVNYVLVPAADGPEVAGRVRSDIMNGDFESVCMTYGYTPYMHKVITRGTMPQLFEDYAYALKDNEISEIVETQDGFYIIDCLEDYLVTESVANNNRIISDARREIFQNEYEKFAASNNMRFNTAVWAKFDVSTMG